MTIAKTKAAEMAYKKVNALRSQMMQTDFNPADDYKGTLMQRPQRRIIKNQQKLKSKSEQEDIIKIAKITDSIQNKFKKEVT
tara:strand:- start:368 stop:613 length:246 start_codon:yes stop_codon:yes gene_type:complete